MTEPVMIVSEDVLIAPTSDTIPDENKAPLSEEETSAKKMNSEKMTYAEAISKQTIEDETDTAISAHDNSTCNAQTIDENESNENTEGETPVNANDTISPMETTNSEVDAFPSSQTPEGEVSAPISQDDNSADCSETKDESECSDAAEMTEANGRITPLVDTDAAESPSQRIEPEGVTPLVSKSREFFDDDLVGKVLSETHKRQEGDKERISLSRKQRTEMAMEDQTKENSDANSQETRKKRQEPPGTPAKHERQKSESAVEREQRIKDTNGNLSPKNIDEKGVKQILRDQGGVVVEEKKGDDDVSIQREPSGPLLSPKRNGSKVWEKETNQEGQPIKIVGSEKPTEITTAEEEKKVEARYQSPSRTSQPRHPDFDNNHSQKQKDIFMQDEKKVEHLYKSPSRIVQRHTLEFNGNHNGQAMSHGSNQHQTYGDNTRQGTLPLSPAFFVEDDDMPIPHLPPLMVPGLGPSFDTMSLQGQGQPVHLNHNGYQQQFHQRPLLSQQQSLLSIPNQVTTVPGGKRKIHLQLWEDVSSTMMKPETSGFLSFRRKKGILRRSPQQSPPISEVDDINHSHGDDNGGNDPNKNNQWADRGTLTVSWYEGTSSLELQEHVQNSVIRKLGLMSTTKLVDFRVLDESTDSPEEIVLSPYIPNGSRLVVRFSTSDDGDATPTKYLRFSDYSGPPDSPSAAPSPFPTSLDLNGLGLNANQLALLGTRLNSLQMPKSESLDTKSRGKLKPKNGKKSQQSKQNQADKSSIKEGDEEDDTTSKDSNFDANSKESNFEVASLHPEDPIQKSLREITGLLLRERGTRPSHVPRQEKRQVLLVLANYFGLFLLFIAILAEIQARAPGWHHAMEQQLKNVHDCSKDKESLLTCVENGDMAGLVASIILWVSRSAATKRVFLLGFNSSNKLWTAVYESLVTSICWGFSYMFIRRGMNPDNNRDFLRRYWKDAVYGSLAGFNAAFMKQVLKNLIPQEAIEDAIQERQLRFLSWLPSIGKM